MENRINRRKMLGTLAFSGLALGVSSSCSTGNQHHQSVSVKKTDGTPMQFSPKNGPDPNPLERDIEKYPKCPYCGMDRKQWNHSRHLIHYSDNMIDPTCSLHCAAIGLSLNIDRHPKAIYAADFGSDEPIKPLVNVADVTYLIGSKLPGTMSAHSKMAFVSSEAAASAQNSKGGETGDLETALTKGYLSMAHDSAMIRKRRAAKKKKMHHG